MSGSVKRDPNSYRTPVAFSQSNIVQPLHTKYPFLAPPDLFYVLERIRQGALALQDFMARAVAVPPEAWTQSVVFLRSPDFLFAQSLQLLHSLLVTSRLHAHYLRFSQSLAFAAVDHVVHKPPLGHCCHISRRAIDHYYTFCFDGLCFDGHLYILCSKEHCYLWRTRVRTPRAEEYARTNC